MKRLMIFLLIFSLIPIVNAQAALLQKPTVDMHYIVVNPADDGTIQIKHMVNYTNAGEEEFKGDDESEGVLYVPLPAGAMDLQVQDQSLDIKTTEKGFVTGKPIPPKETQVIAYSYMMPAGLPITIKLDYSLQVMQVLIQEGAGSIRIEGAKSSNAGLMQFEEKNFWLYNVEEIQENQEIKLFYDKNTQPVQDGSESGNGEQMAADQGKGSTENVTRNSPQFHNPGHLRLWYQSPLKKFNPHILLIVLGAILTAGLGYYSYFKWKARLQDQKIGSDKEEQLFQQLIARQNAIMDKILELEDSYAEAKVSEEDYQAKLTAYKQHLVKVKLNLRNFVD
jgi:hypothetical protein